MVRISKSDYPLAALPTLKSNVKLEGGQMKQLTHLSTSTKTEMTFSVFLPAPKARRAANPPVLIYLSGLTCSDENARTKVRFTML